MALYEALQGCYVLGVEMKSGQKIELDEENEKALKLGKYAVEKVDKKTGVKYKSGYQNLKRCKGSMDPEQAVGVADGMIVFPPKKPFNLLGPSR